MYSEERRELEDRVIENIGREKWEEIKNEENEGIDYILGLHTEENKDVDSTKRYLGKLWRKRMGNEVANGDQRSGMSSDHEYYHVRN